jgi:hypothetical protein
MIKTSLGTVRKIGINEQVPQGWRLVRLEEGRQIAGELAELVEEWGIVGFEHGKLDGAGYGRKIGETRGSECGELFIV